MHDRINIILFTIDLLWIDKKSITHKIEHYSPNNKIQTLDTRDNLAE